MKFYKLGILLTRICNQNCYYCNNYVNGNISETDIDYLIWVLKCFNNSGVENLYIELSGGEPGLIPNLYDVVENINSLSFVKKIDILSNGYVRKIIPDIFVDFNITGIEHTAYSIDKKTIKYFYDDITYFNDKYLNNKHLLILDDLTITSLIENFDYFKKLGLFDIQHRIVLKILTPKLQDLSNELIAKYKMFYAMLYANRIIGSKLLAMDCNYIERIEDESVKEACARVTSTQYIDLDNKVIGQCSMNVEKCNHASITVENIQKLVRAKLFLSTFDYCKKCLKFKTNAYKHLALRNNNIYINTETKDESDF